MPVKVLVVQIQPVTILSYSEQVRHKRLIAFFPPFWHSFQYWAANCCLFLKFVLSVSKFCQKIEFDVLS